MNEDNLLDHAEAIMEDISLVFGHINRSQHDELYGALVGHLKKAVHEALTAPIPPSMYGALEGARALLDKARPPDPLTPALINALVIERKHTEHLEALVRDMVQDHDKQAFLANGERMRKLGQEEMKQAIFKLIDGRIIDGYIKRDVELCKVR